MLIKLSKVAKQLDVTTSTLFGWARKGFIQLTKSPTGRNYVSEEELTRIENGRKTKVK